MEALKLAIAAIALGLATTAHADSVTRWQPYIVEASARFGVPEAWIARVIRAESGGLTMLAGRPITSRAGAMGLMQLMPATWAEMRAAHHLGIDPHNPRDNILAGAAYLRLMVDRFGYPGLFAGYNAGPGRYANHLATGRALPGETRAYLAKLAPGHATVATTAWEGHVNGLFFTLRGASAQSPVQSRQSSPNRLFVVLNTSSSGEN